jgi:hypothetical protein
MLPSWIPAEPEVPPEQRGRGRMHLRFEDVSQNGHLVVEALPQALRVIWRALASRRRAALPGAAARGAKPPELFPPGVLSILSRVITESGDGPISVDAEAEAEGFYHLAHTTGPDGAVDRIILAMWAQVIAPIGRTHPPDPPAAGRPVVAGRVFAEHVFTRPFGPPAERKVRALDLGAGPFVPEARYAFRPPEATVDLPDGAAPLDAAPVPDEASTLFGLDHSDSNQHVNSLVYPRLFIEAALRRLHALGRSAPPPLVRVMDLAFRKPCFAGERARIASRAFEVAGEGDVVTGVTGALFGEGDGPGARPRCAARLVFER